MSRNLPLLVVGVLGSLYACGKSHRVEIGDGGMDALGCPPALPEMCVRGVCCDEGSVEAERVPGTCDFRCPSGSTFASSCEPAPTCDRDTCADNTECVLAINTCCGPCGMPGLSDYDAIRRDRQDEHFTMVCPAPEFCPDCAVDANPGLGATCAGGHCQGFDISTLPLTECERDTDCMLRVPDCCVCGAGTDEFNLIAVRTDAEADYQALVCPAEFGCAADCVPAYPSNLEAACVAGRCTVERTATR